MKMTINVNNKTKLKQLQEEIELDQDRVFSTFEQPKLGEISIKIGHSNESFFYGFKHFKFTELVKLIALISVSSLKNDQITNLLTWQGWYISNDNPMIILNHNIYGGYTIGDHSNKEFKRRMKTAYKLKVKLSKLIKNNFPNQFKEKVEQLIFEKQ